MGTADDVDRAMKKATTGVTLVVINSVDGCSAGMARPGVRLALEGDAKRPDQLLTVFDEQDVEATAQLRSYFADVPPSHPSITLFKDGELVHFVPRHRIEGRDAQSLAIDLESAFNEFGQQRVCQEKRPPRPSPPLQPSQTQKPPRLDPGRLPPRHHTRELIHPTPHTPSEQHKRIWPSANPQRARSRPPQQQSRSKRQSVALTGFIRSVDPGVRGGT
ncbi:BrxA/BrxB family bacilliredoxin [Streptomyces sp. SM11]|uniref:BrxA/BrxB family bacilliredoxin n=1 Tax=Streptomyces sp. SM11 TaxID=565557 RepID=UPI00215657C8|nr:BrxA/BrxB family bacilliredoxin [Streptomyces sp. SM11]